MGTLTAPTSLSIDHDLESFNCGVPSLDDWLKRRAMQNDQNGASRTYVICEEARVVGYYCLAAGAVSCKHASGKIRRNMPDPIPVIIIGRLAVDRDWKGLGIGVDLMFDAASRAFNAADVVGVRAILVHALTDTAARFYKRWGFVESLVDPLTLIVTLKDLKHAITVN